MELVYGRRPILEVLRAGKRSLHKVWVAEGAHGTEEILQAARQQGVPVERAPRANLDRLVRGHHQGVVAQVSAASYLELDDFLKQLGPSAPAIVVGLDEIQDPQNVGAILRSAGFFGVQAILVPRWRNAPIGEAVMRASSGAAEHLAIIRVRNLVDAMDQLKIAGFEVFGADMSGSPLTRQAHAHRAALILGGEGEGLRRLVKERCDKLIGIPRRGPIDSLNVGSAAAIFLYEFSRPQ